MMEEEEKEKAFPWMEVVGKAVASAVDRAGGLDGWTMVGLSPSVRGGVLRGLASLATDPRLTVENGLEVVRAPRGDWRAPLTTERAEGWISKMEREAAGLGDEVARDVASRMFSSALDLMAEDDADLRQGGVNTLFALLSSEWATGNVSSRFMRETAWRLGKNGEVDAVVGIRQLLSARGQGLDSEEILQMAFIGSCAGGAMEAAKAFLEMGASLNGHCPPKARTERAGGTALCQAIGFGRPEMARWLSGLGGRAGPAHAVADFLWRATPGETEAAVGLLREVDWDRSDSELRFVAEKAGEAVDWRKMAAISPLLEGVEWSQSESRGFWFSVAGKVEKENVLDGSLKAMAVAAMGAGITPPSEEDAEKMDAFVSRLGREGSGFLARKRFPEVLEEARRQACPDAPQICQTRDRQNGRVGRDNGSPSRERPRGRRTP